MAEDKQKQNEIFERLQVKVLEEFEKKIDENSLSGTDLSTLVRLMEHNGWTFDLARAPQGLKSKLTDKVDPKRFAADDADVVGKIA